MKPLGGLDEFGLIAHLTSRYQARCDVRADTIDPSAIRVGIGDDAAVVALPDGEESLLTTDTMVEGVHFLASTMGFADVGYKAVAASVSDVAAMGGRPLGVLMSIAIGQTVDLPALEALYDGVADICLDSACTLVGGDVVSTAGPLVVTSTVIGSVPAGTAVRRSGARPGDVVFVTGSVGGSGAGLALRMSQAEGRAALVAPDEALVLIACHRRPKPQVTAGGILRACGVSSLNDVSDGLASELNEIARASQVRLRLDSQRIPMLSALHNFARSRSESALQYAWYGGEDYQLVGTASPLSFARALAQCEGVGIPLTQIGRVEPGAGEVVAVSPDGRIDLLEPRGYNHFHGDEAK